MIHCVAGPQFVSPFFLSWTLRRLRHLLAVGRGVTVNVHEHCLSVHGSSAFWGVCTQENCRVLWSPCVELFIESHTGCQHFTQPPSRAEGSSFSTSSPAQVIIRFFFFCNHPRGCEAVSGCGFDLHFLNNQWCGLPGSSPGGTREFEAGTESARKNLFI